VSSDTHHHRPKPQDDEQAFLKSVQQTLDAATSDLDEKTSSALRNIRHAALQQPAHSVHSVWTGAAGMISIGVSVFAIALTIMQPKYHLSSLDDNVSLIEDIELISSSEDFELYDNLDFYIWLNELNEAS